MNDFSHSFCYRTESDVHVAKKISKFFNTTGKIQYYVNGM